ncbi:MAG: hypothetical protein ACI9OJ_004986 [Myxococcota bacterium]
MDAISDFIDRFDNPRRRHSTLGDVSPHEHEMITAKRQKAT